MVKDLRVVLIDSSSANRFVRRYHYSGKIVNNSKIHFGVMQGNNLKGVMSFGYRATGFNLVGVKKNISLRVMESGQIIAKKTLEDHRVNGQYLSACIKTNALEGFQIKYIYFLDPEAKKDLTVPILPYSAIEAAGAKMYKGKRGGSSKVEHSEIQPREGGAVPTSPLHNGGSFNGTSN